MTEAEYLADLKAEIIRAVRAELAARDDRPLLRIKDLGARLGISERSARGLVDRGVIPSFRVGPDNGSVVVAPADADAYVARQQEGSDDG